MGINYKSLGEHGGLEGSILYNFECEVSVLGFCVGGYWRVCWWWLFCGLFVAFVCFCVACLWLLCGLCVAWVWHFCVGGNQRTELDSVYEVGQDGFVMVCFVEIKQAFLGEDCPIIYLPK